MEKRFKTKALKYIWPKNGDTLFHSGFSDDYLEWISTSRIDSEIPKIDTFKSPILFWPPELYGNSRCYREWLGWPMWLPLPFYDDHGPQTSLKFSEHEIHNQAKYHLTYNKKRATYNSSIKNVIAVQCPWIIYRRRSGYEKQKDAKGTLIFFPHTTDGIELLPYDWDGYFSLLKSLPPEYSPLVICLHRHDVRKGFHKSLRKYGLPIVSLGETLSPFFVDRFYSLVSNFRYATSNTGGSEIFFCEEIGVHYFLFGSAPTYFNQSHDQMPIGKFPSLDPITQENEILKQKYFVQFPPRATIEKKRLVEEVLGLDINPFDVKPKIKSIMVPETMRLWHEVIPLLAKKTMISCIPAKYKASIKNTFLEAKRCLSEFFAF